MSWGQPDFSWPISPAGYRCVWATPLDYGHQGKESTWCVIDQGEIDQGETSREVWPTYRPFEVPGLFKRFADITTVEDPEARRAAFLAFVERFGLLTIEEEFDRDLYRTVLFGSTARRGVPVGELEHQAELLHQAFSLWEALDEPGLSSRLRWNEDELCFDGSSVLWDSIGAYFLLDPRGGDLERRQGMPIEHAARELLVYLVNVHSRALVASMVVDADGCFAVRSHDSPDLLAALWLQFSQAILTGQRFRRCSECEEVFELTGRSDKETCSIRCRSRRSRRLRAGGVSRPRGRPRRQKETE